MSRNVHDFSRTPSISAPRSVFNLTHNLKTAFDAAYLIPICVEEVLPGDTWKVGTNNFARLATPLHPIMDNMYIETFWFFTPNRLLWDHWVNFMGEKDSPSDTTTYEMPTVKAPAVEGYASESIFDYMGLPVGAPDLVHQSLPLRAEALIWNTWFRDENLQEPTWFDSGDGPDDPTDYHLKRRGKRKDYISGALPWPQKGPDVTIPVGVSAPVAGTGAPTFTDSTGVPRTEMKYDSGGTLTGAFVAQEKNLQESSVVSWGDPHLVADLSLATGISISEFRELVALQHMFERDARGGTRYQELLLSQYGVVGSDSRLMRPEFLHATSQPFNVHPVAQTTPATNQDVTLSPQGNLAAFGTSAHRSRGFSKSFTEHGQLTCLAVVRADLTYQYSLERRWSRKIREDFYFPAFAHLSEQAILNKEVYAEGPAGNDEGVFGYTGRHNEYRHKNSYVTGVFRSEANATLDPWHLAQEWDSLPVLGDPYIQDDPPIDRVVAVNTEPHCLIDIQFRMQVARAMPTFPTPGLRRL